MPIVRGGYGYSAYSASDYGTEGSIVDGAAVVSASSTVNAEGGRSITGIPDAISSTSSTTATAYKTVGINETITGTATVTASGEQFVLEDTSKLQYGGGAYGLNVYDNADLQTIAMATSVSSSASGEIIKLGGAVSTPSATVASICERIKLAGSTVTAGSANTANAVYSISGNATITATSTNAGSIERVREVGGTIAGTNTFTASGRYKYEQIAKDNETWNDVSAAGGTWTEVA